MYIKIDENKRVIMQIADKFAEGLEVDNKTTFRTASGLFPMKNDEVLYYNPETDTFHTEKVEYTEEQIAKAKAIAEARAKKAKALAWLAENDWKVNKRMLGEWAEDDERWVTYIADRAKARAEIDEADAVLNA
jgi:hypothetical protein